MDGNGRSPLWGLYGFLEMNGGRSAKTPRSAGANLGFEEKLWKTADKLRNNMDAAEYKHVVLGLVFLKYNSDAFEERRAQLLRELEHGGDPEDKNEYVGSNVFWVLKEPELRSKSQIGA